MLYLINIHVCARMLSRVLLTPYVFYVPPCWIKVLDVWSSFLSLAFVRPYLGKMFLVIVDAYSNFVDIVPMSHATTANSIAALWP